MHRLLHSQFVHAGRIRRLAGYLSPLIPRGASLLDIGCGDGKLARGIASTRRDIAVQGVDVVLRRTSEIPTQIYEGRRVPYPDGAFDISMLIDVLHHAEDPTHLLREASRVSRGGVLVKDHVAESALDQWILRSMDYIANARHGLRLPQRYWSWPEWSAVFEELGLHRMETIELVKLYPGAANLVFGRKLHFICLLGGTPR